MKKVFSLCLIGMFVILTVNAQTKWMADPAHTNATFTVKHLGISFVDGYFKTVTGTVETKTATDFNDAKINFSIETGSIDTRIDARNNHLKSDAFFNVEKFPTMKLSSVTFKKVSSNKYKLIADLTIRDVTKKVIFTAVQNGGVIKDPWGKTRTGFTASTTINRHDFGMTYNDKLPSGVEAVASMVSIVINTELVEQ